MSWMLVDAAGWRWVQGLVIHFSEHIWSTAFAIHRMISLEPSTTL